MKGEERRAGVEERGGRRRGEELRRIEGEEMRRGGAEV